MIMLFVIYLSYLNIDNLLQIKFVKKFEHWRIKGVFDNLVKFVCKLGKNWQTRAWDPVFKTAGSAPDAAMILGLFSQKNLKINIDRKLYWIVHFYLDFFCASSE